MPHMRCSLALALLGLSVALVHPLPAQAGSQQDRMRSCNKEAKEKALKGDERRAFMSSCLSSGKKDGDKTGGAATASDEARLRKKQCTADAKEKSLTGDERKAFIADCVKDA